MRHLVHLMAVAALLGVAACSSSFGTGSSPPPAKVLVVPAAPACPNGAAPPCQ